MRILLVTFCRDNRFTGMGKQTHRLAEALRARGHEVTLWFEDDFPFHGRLGRVAVLTFPLALAWRIRRRRRAFDLVQVHEPSGYWISLLRRRSAAIPPVVAMCHNVESKVFRVLQRAAAARPAWVSRRSRLKPLLFRLWQSDGTIRRADHVVCLSSEDHAYIAGTLGVPAQRVTRITNGADPVPDPARGRPATPGSRILFVGGWLDIKGKRLLVEAFELLRRRVPSAELTLAGTSAPPQDVLREFPAPARDGVSVIPRVREWSEMADLYARHDVFFMPSVTEGSPLALLEAMAAGVPPVAARVGGVPDIVEDGVTGLLFDPFDAGAAAEQLRRLLSDAALAGRLGARARADAVGRTWAAAAQSLEGAYRLALAAGAAQ